MKPALCCLGIVAATFFSCARKDSSKPIFREPDVTITLGTVVGEIAPLLGVNIGPLASPVGPATPDLTQAYQEIGVTMVRTHDFYGPLDMCVMYRDRTRDPSDPGSYDFAASDLMWQGIVSGGFEPYFRLGDSWNNATPPTNAQERANWAQAAVEVVRHYREGKWNGYATPFRYVEIWNEPDLQQFWPPPRTRLEFFQLFVETILALKQAFPDMKVGGPGVTQMGFMTAQGQEWIRSFLSYLKDHNAPLDFFSWHLYSNNPEDWRTGARFYRSELDAKGFTSAEMHVTEWNTDIMTIGDNSPEAFALRTGGKGAAILSAAWMKMQEERVAVATLYRGPDPAVDAPTFYGMFYADGRPKRVALAFSLWSGMASYPKRVQVSASPEGVLWLLAGEDAAGQKALLVANTSDRAVVYAIEGTESTDMTVMQVSDANASVEELAADGAGIDIGAYTVQLVRINRGN
ncbi:MAG: hypothetical protein ONB07_06065 [candidate division KSB1 bacterium]|nr:hypothetical protein [candidate division KSB1 bacterium]MDZ7393832.1 hypothetical protein [candidate division KSB1 bacterium]